MRLSLTLAAALLCAPLLPAAQAQPAPSPEPAPAAPTPASRPDPVVAKVGGVDIHLSDVSEAAQTLPEEVRSMPPQVLFPMLLDQMVDREALVIEAKKEGLDKQPQVQRAIDRATDQVLQNALLSKEIAPSVTDAALKTKYDSETASKPGEEEVHAAHILVETEDQAKAIIAKLDAGADFATLAKEQSKDPAAQNGGDLGWFKKADMVPEFADAAFALKPGDYTRVPVHTQFGYHIIKSLEQRTAGPVPFDQGKDELRQGVIQAGVRQAVDQARKGLVIEKFNMDGSPATASATPDPTATPTTDLPPTPGTTPAVPK